MNTIQSKRVPWVHQQQGFDYAFGNPGAALFMGVGSGKTKVTVDTVANSGHQRGLIITLKNVIDDGVWGREFEKNSIIPYTVVSLNKGSTLDKIEIIKSNYKRLHVVFEITYQTMIRPEMRDLLYKLSWDFLVLDEGHMVKSSNSSMNKTSCTLGRRAAQRFLLTGTPMPNGAQDVYGLFKFIDPRVFGTRKQDFEDRYCVMGGFNGTQVVGYRNMEELHDKIAKNSFYVRTRDVLDLPPEMDLYRVSELEPAVQKIYKTLKKESVVNVPNKGTITASNSLVLQTRLSQIVGGFATLDDGQIFRMSNAKLGSYKDLLDSLLVENLLPRIITFCRYTEEIKATKAILGCYGSVGELSGRRSDLLEWQKGGLLHLVIQEEAGNAGIDLTPSSNVIFYSKTFSLGNHEQCRGRFVRTGQNSPVTFFHMQTLNTIDRVVDQALSDKSDMVRALEDYIRSNT